MLSGFNQMKMNHIQNYKCVSYFCYYGCFPVVKSSYTTITAFKFAPLIAVAHTRYSALSLTLCRRLRMIRVSSRTSHQI